MQNIEEIDALLAEIGVTATKTLVKGIYPPLYEYVVVYSDIFMRDSNIGARARQMFISRYRPQFYHVDASLRQLYGVYRKFGTLPQDALIDHCINVDFDTLIEIYCAINGTAFRPYTIVHTLLFNTHTDLAVILYHINKLSIQYGFDMYDTINSAIVKIHNDGLQYDHTTSFTCHIRRYLQLYPHMGKYIHVPPKVDLREDLRAIEVQDRAYKLSMRERVLASPLVWYARAMTRNGARHNHIAYICAHALLGAHEYNDAQIYAILHDPIGAHLGSVMARRRKFGHE